MPMNLLPDLPSKFVQLVTPIVDTGDAAFVVSLDCQFLAWGSRAQQLFGFGPAEVLGRYCYDVLPAYDASGQCVCSVNCPLVTAARFGYSPTPSEVRICTKGNSSIWVRVSPIVLRAAYGAVCAIVVLASDVSRYRFAEQLVRWLVSRLEETDISSEFGVRDATTMLRNSFPDLTAREAEVLWAAVAGQDYHGIASALGMQPATARNHLQRVLGKLGVHSQRRAVLKAALVLIAPATASWSTAYAVTNDGAVNGRDLHDLAHRRDAIKPCRHRGTRMRDRGGR
jgi:DNA-binding CsgD family transcriptional regulator